jgi:hypothetical protein
MTDQAAPKSFWKNFSAEVTIIRNPHQEAATVITGVLAAREIVFLQFGSGGTDSRGGKITAVV